MKVDNLSYPLMLMFSLPDIPLTVFPFLFARVEEDDRYSSPPSEPQSLPPLLTPLPDDFSYPRKASTPNPLEGEWGRPLRPTYLDLPSQTNDGKCGSFLFKKFKYFLKVIRNSWRLFKQSFLLRLFLVWKLYPEGFLILFENPVSKA